MAFDAKSGILKAINETNDPAMKTVLLLMLGVFEEIVEKIDTVINNDSAIRAMVLNDHEPAHHTHHEWLANLIARDEEIKVLASSVKIRMQEEKEHLASKRKVGESLVIEICKYVFIGGSSILLSKYFGI